MSGKIMSSSGPQEHPVLVWRRSLAWTQDELATRSGVPRSTVSAIEARRMTPSVLIAVAIARALRRPIEELFAPVDSASSPVWAWSPLHADSRYWTAEVAGRRWLYPALVTQHPSPEHDGVARRGAFVERGDHDALGTLVLAGCDPAMGLLASSLARTSGFRVLVFPMGGAEALELLATGRVHVAALHRSTPEEPDRNARTLHARIGSAGRLLRAAEWEEGVVLSKHSRVRSAEACRRSVRRWAVREAGSGAFECLEELLGRPPPRGRVWRGHAAVAEAVRLGFADAGVCVRVCAEEAGLPFLPVRKESLDYCFSSAVEDDPRVKALIRLVGSSEHRARLGDLPGYDVRRTGALERVRGP